MAREIEARLKLSAIDRTKKAFDSVAHNLDRIDKKSRAVERAQQSMGRAEAMQGRIARTEAAFLARAGGVLAPAALAYGAGRAYKQFAGVERELTRIGLKAGATQDQMRMVRNEIEQVGHKWAVPIADVTETFDTLIESGFEFDHARRQLSDMVKVTQALGGAGADTVQTWDALRKNLGASEGEFMAFFDAIAAGGAAGKFEASDIAQYLPILAPSAAKMGINTLDEFQGMIGVLEALRDVSGDSSQTVTSMSDFLEKLTSPAVVKAFKGADIDMFKELDKAEESGEDLWNTMHRLMKAATGGDARRLGEFFGDKEARRMATLLLTDLDRVLASIEKVKGAARGQIDINVNAVIGNSQAKIDRLSNSIDALITEGGAALATWLNDPLEGAGDALARGNAYDAGLERLAQEGGTKDQARKDFDKRYGEANPDFDWWNPLDHQDRAKAFVRGVQAYGRGEIESPQDFVLKQLADRAREGEETILKASDILADPSAALGLSTGRIATPSARPDPSAPSPAGPEGSISARALEYPTSPVVVRQTPAPDNHDPWISAPSIGLRVGPYTGDEDARAAADARWQQILVDHAESQRLAAAVAHIDTRYGPQLPPRGGPLPGEAPAMTLESVAAEADALRTAMEAGGQSVAQGGRDAQTAIDQGGEQLPVRGREAGAAFSQSATAGMATQARAWGAAMAAGFNANVKVPTGGSLIGSMAGGATRPAARSMPDAGVAGEQ